MPKSILEMPTFQDPYSPLQGKELPDTELFLRAVFYIMLLVGVVGGKKRIVGEGEERNWSVFNNREDGFPYYLCCSHYLYLDC